MDASTQTATGGKLPNLPKLEDQAATAALYVTSPQRQNKSKYPLDKDNKLSSAGAATSLKYANPRDLPSFPSAGLVNKDSSAGAAASLANANHKTFEHWKPESSTPASKAAMMAKDYKAAPLWEPTMSSAGSKAALIAANHGGKVNIWRPEATSEGNSAAGQAMRNKNLSPVVDFGYTADGSSRALMAATGAMSGRKRAGSNPIITGSYPDSANSKANALNAATAANKPSSKANQSSIVRPDRIGLSSTDAARIHKAALTNLGREMYTSHPPVAPEVEEKNRQAGIHAAAVSMAKQIYDLQQKTLEAHAGVQRSDSHYAANSVHRRQSSLSSSTEDTVQAPPQYANLQEAAQKLAAERLAKLYDGDAAYRDYYGAHAPARSRLSVRGRLRRRASSDGEIPESDEVRSYQIRSEMSIFNDKLAQVDAKKRQKDRDSLLAAAQRNVTASMQGLDEKVFSETGKASPAMMEEWEAKAKARAEADSSARMVNHGKVDIGGGRFMDKSEVDAIAAARVQPTLDEITEKAESQRARDEKVRQEAEEQRQIAEEKSRIEKERNTKTKEEWKQFKEEEKREERVKKDEEKAKKAEEKRLREEEKRFQKEEKRKSKTAPVSKAPGIEVEPQEEPVIVPETPVLDPIPTLAPISTDTAELTEPTITSNEETIEHEEPVEHEEPIDSQPFRTEETPLATKAEEPTDLTTDSTISPTDPSSRPKHIEPVATRVAPPIAAHEPAPVAKAVNDDQSAQPPQDSSKLSSWLKTKFRRSAKPLKSSSEPAESGSSSTTIKAPSAATSDATPITQTTTATTTDTPDADSVHEVAMATTGKQAPYSVTAIQPTPLGSNPPGPAKHSRSHSTSISSLSSDEPIHAAPIMHNEEMEAERGRSSLRREVTASTLYGDGYHDHAPDRDEEGEREEEGEEGEFEEARDTFDAGELPMPAFVAEGRVGKGAAESPVRDSRFVEDL